MRGLYPTRIFINNHRLATTGWRTFAPEIVVLVDEEDEDHKNPAASEGGAPSSLCAVGGVIDVSGGGEAKFVANPLAKGAPDTVREPSPAGGCGGVVGTDKQGKGLTYAGAFFRGLVFGLVQSPCTGPFAASLLLRVAVTGNLLWGFLALFVFALGNSTVLLVCAVFSGLATQLPEPGLWMATLKNHSGYVSLCYLLSLSLCACVFVCVFVCLSL